jgi:TolB protein
MISPDGRTVAYWGYDALGGLNGGSIYTVALDGRSRPVRLTDRPPGSDADPAWSPDGSMIAFRRRIANDNFDVYLMQSDGSDVRPLVSTPAMDEKPAWSPDGRELMILSNRGMSGRPGTPFDGYVVDVADGLSRPLALTAKVLLTSVWSYR